MSLLKASILVIDDDVDVLTAVRLLLKTEAQQVMTEKKSENVPSRIVFCFRNFGLKIRKPSI